MKLGKRENKFKWLQHLFLEILPSYIFCFVF